MEFSNIQPTQNNSNQLLMSQECSQQGKNQEGTNQLIADSQNINKPSFLIKLYEMVDKNETNSIVSWIDDGEGFTIKDVKLFCTQILPVYFKHNNFSSFIRQLNMYDFYKKNRNIGNDNVFRHPQFIRGQIQLVSQIQRKTNLKHEKNLGKRDQKQQVKEQKKEDRKQAKQIENQNKRQLKKAQKEANKCTSRRNYSIQQYENQMRRQSLNPQMPLLTDPIPVMQKNKTQNPEIKTNYQGIKLHDIALPIQNGIQQYSHLQLQQPIGLNTQLLNSNIDTFKNVQLQKQSPKPKKFLNLSVGNNLSTITENFNRPKKFLNLQASNNVSQITDNQAQNMSYGNLSPMIPLNTLFTQKNDDATKIYQYIQQPQQFNTNLNTQQNIGQNSIIFKETGTGQLANSSRIIEPNNQQNLVHQNVMTNSQPNNESQDLVNQKLIALNQLISNMERMNSTKTTQIVAAPEQSQIPVVNMKESQKEIPNQQLVPNNKNKWIEIQDSAMQFSRTLQMLLNNFTDLEYKLGKLTSSEQQQSTDLINDQLNSQLMSSKQNEQDYEKLMTWVLKIFFQKRNKSIPSNILLNPQQDLIKPTMLLQYPQKVRQSIDTNFTDSTTHFDQKKQDDLINYVKQKQEMQHVNSSGSFKDFKITQQPNVSPLHIQPQEIRGLVNGQPTLELQPQPSLQPQSQPQQQPQRLTQPQTQPQQQSQPQPQNKSKVVTDMLHTIVFKQKNQIQLTQAEKDFYGGCFQMFQQPSQDAPNTEILNNLIAAQKPEQTHYQYPLQDNGQNTPKNMVPASRRVGGMNESDDALGFRRPSTVLVPNYRRDSMISMQRRGSIILNGKGFGNFINNNTDGTQFPAQLQNMIFENGKPCKINFEEKTTYVNVPLQ